jgi:hypothetical protein
MASIRDRNVTTIPRRTRRAALRCVLGAACVAAPLALLLYPGVARAGFALGADFDLGIPIGKGKFSIGPGVDGRAGWRIGLGPVFLQPELLGGFRSFGDATLGRVMAGARFGGGGFVQPSLFAHAGGAFGRVSGFAAHGGVALDFKIVPIFSLGLHAGFNLITDKVTDPSGLFKWVDVGIQAGLHF